MYNLKVTRAVLKYYQWVFLWELATISRRWTGPCSGKNIGFHTLGSLVSAQMSGIACRSSKRHRLGISDHHCSAVITVIFRLDTCGHRNSLGSNMGSIKTRTETALLGCVAGICFAFWLGYQMETKQKANALLIHRIGGWGYRQHLGIGDLRSLMPVAALVSFERRISPQLEAYL